jgi:osmoprotectant transport system permease protein
MTLDPFVPIAALGLFGDAVDFIFNEREALDRAVMVGGLEQIGELAWEQLKVTLYALALSLALALPAGIALGHAGRGEGLAIAIGNAGRAIPELALIALLVAFLDVDMFTLALALSVLGIPPILTNSFVGVRGVDRNTVEAARGMGMTEGEVIRKVELPLAVPSIMSGIRTATINIVATATIAPLVGVLTLGDFILSRNVYGDAGVLAGAMVVALMALALELILAGVQRILTPRGLRLAKT